MAPKPPRIMALVRAPGTPNRTKLNSPDNNRRRSTTALPTDIPHEYTATLQLSHWSNASTRPVVAGSSVTVSVAVQESAGWRSKSTVF